MVEAQMKADAQILMDKGGEVQSCGFHLKGVHVSSTEARVFDSSLMIHRGGYGLVKMVGLVSPTRVPDELKARDIYGAWFRAPGSLATVPNTELMDGQTPKSMMFGTSTPPTVAALYAIATGKVIQVAVRWEPDNETVYFGSPALSPAHQQQFFNCVEDLAKDPQ